MDTFQIPRKSLRLFGGYQRHSVVVERTITIFGLQLNRVSACSEFCIIVRSLRLCHLVSAQERIVSVDRPILESSFKVDGSGHKSEAKKITSHTYNTSKINSDEIGKKSHACPNIATGIYARGNINLKKDQRLRARRNSMRRGTIERIPFKNVILTLPMR